jgi:hypothetical protein
MSLEGYGYQPGVENLVLETVRALRGRGYEGQCEATGQGMRCPHCGQLVGLDDLVFDEVHRFEGESNPDDEALVMGLRCRSCGWRGTLVTGYGPSVPEADADLLFGLAARIGADRSAGRTTRSRG